MFDLILALGLPGVAMRALTFGFLWALRSNKQPSTLRPTFQCPPYFRLRAHQLLLLLELPGKAQTGLGRR